MEKKVSNKKKARRLYLVALIFAPYLTLILASCIVSNSYATPSSISISLSSAPSVNIASISEGKFGDSGNSTITITTTHAAGYTLTTKASNSTNLEGTNGGSIPSITSAVSPTNYADNTYASSHNLNDTWAYKPSVLYNASTQTTNPNTDYLPSPGTDTAQSPIDTLAVTNDANDGSYTVSIGARVSTATAIDEYSNQFVFAVVGNPTPYAITYNKNTTDTVTNMPTNHTTSDSGANGETVTIDSTVPVRDGYTFKGWCSTTISDDTCSGTVYNPDGGGTALALTINQTSSTNAFTLYAMWEVDEINLYNTVASMSKGKQTAADLRTSITVPTSDDYTTDTSNSGVYEYDPSVFGTASDASNDNKIYYYRGVLENNPGTYGSDGSAVTYPNYVKLGNTCWRIVRTTGSGGIKMIYNGLYGATTAGSCANTQTNAQVAGSAFNGTSSANQQIVRAGYTHNSTYAVNTSQSGTIAQVFGSNSDPSVNDTRSTIKEYVEDTWYTGTSGVSAYTNMLEPSAGYCNDRTMNTTYSWTTPLAESTTIAATYGTSGLQLYIFGYYPRNLDTAQLPSLTCGNRFSQIDRSIVDLYRYNGTNGAAGSTAANYLKYPAALLTADEASFAGSGSAAASQGSAYNANSYLRSNRDFWLLSPNRSNGLNGYVRGGELSMTGSLSDINVSSTQGVRPSISLTSGTTAVSGSGTATDPWVVNAP
ncbi:hypothetical protein IKF21_00985 [Candidatus Saccharibacteria bacterium]|nr:hypothetical protein [Candidatus Saccharibacteria bacterium]